MVQEGGQVCVLWACGAVALPPCLLEVVGTMAWSVLAWAHDEDEAACACPPLDGQKDGFACTLQASCLLAASQHAAGLSRVVCHVRMCHFRFREV